MTQKVTKYDLYILDYYWKTVEARKEFYELREIVFQFAFIFRRLADYPDNNNIRLDLYNIAET